MMPLVTVLKKADGPSLHSGGEPVLTVDVCAYQKGSLVKALDLVVVTPFAVEIGVVTASLETAVTPVYKTPSLNPPFRPPAA